MKLELKITDEQGNEHLYNIVRSEMTMNEMRKIIEFINKIAISDVDDLGSYGQV
jgi:uncharacterized protein YrzB (UPF0473 family)